MIKYGLSPSTQITAPSFVPGRNITFDRQRQIQYINKALHVDGTEPVSLHHQAKPNETQTSAHDLPAPQQTQNLNQPETTKFPQTSPAIGDTQQKSSPLMTNPTYNPIYSPPVKFQSQPPFAIDSRQETKSILQNYPIPDWRKDYFYVRNKNGPYSNPLNIITGEYKRRPTPF